jgi:hypothetical protein
VWCRRHQPLLLLHQEVGEVEEQLQKVSKQAALAPLSQWLVANLDLPGLSLSLRFPHFTSCSRQSRALRLSPGRGWGAECEYLQSGAAGGSVD